MSKSCPNVEIIEFVRPDRNECNIFVTNIPPEYEEAELQEVLLSKFSPFGLIYEIQVKTPPSKVAAEGGGYYAFVKFFSAMAAATAKRELTGRLFLRGQHLKMQFAKRAKIESPQPLYVTRCYELANHYLTFNGWSLTLLKLEIATDLSPQVEGQVGFMACVRLRLVESGLHADGVGRSTQAWNVTDPSSRSVATCRAKKQAYQFAVQAAFRKVLLVVTETSKVHVEVNTTIEEELNEQIDMEPVVKVQDLDDSPEESSDEDTDLDLLNQQILADLAQEAKNANTTE